MVAYALNSLASAYLYEGKYVEAEQLLQRVLAIGEALGNNHPMLADSLNSLANLYNVQGKYVQAEPLYQRAIAIDMKVLGSEHPNLATRFNSLAELYWNQGKYEQAEQLSQQALAIRQKALGAEHPYVATKSQQPGRTLLEIRASTSRLNRSSTKPWPSGRKRWELSIPMWQKSLSRPGPALQLAQGKYEQAEPLFHQALAIWQKSAGSRASQCSYQSGQPGRTLPRPGQVRAGRTALPASPGHPAASAGSRASRCSTKSQWPGRTLLQPGQVRAG